jgi:hypothetical protein
MVSLLRALLLLALASSLGCGRDLKRRDGGDAISADAPMVSAKDVLPSTPSAEVTPDLDRDAADGREAGGNPDMAAATPCVGPLPATSFYCSASFDDVVARTVSCISYETIDVGECASDHLLMFRRDFGTHGDECLYDPQSRALVAERFWNDIPVCDDSRVEIHVADGMTADFCAASCKDGCTDRFVRLERYADCCRSWAYPIPGCPVDGGRTDAPEVAADRPPSPDRAICSGTCNAAVPTYPTVDATSGSGNVTMYTTLPSSGGACNYGTTGVAYFAAINVNVEPSDDQGQWQGGRICGQCVEVTTSTSQGSRSVVVRIMDRCADAYCGVDLGGDAPVAVMPDGFGRYDGTWRFVPCAGHPEASDGPPSLYVVAGSNAWWSRVQVRNPPWAVESIAWRDPAGSASGSFPYAADPENTFAVPSDALQATASWLAVTVRYGDGTTATAELAPSQLAAAGTSYPLQ